MGVGNIINKSNLKWVLILFDHFYRMGVIDAMDKTDQWQARDFISRMRESGTYGTIDRDYSMGWKQWLALVRYECSLQNWRTTREILGCITSSRGYVATILPMTMAYYLKGIEDYWNNPNPVNKTLFLSKNFNLWAEKIKSRNINGMIEDAQLMTVDIGHNNQDFITMSQVIYQASRHGKK